MKSEKLFRAFKRKLIFEAAIKSLIFGIGCSAIPVFTISVIYHILIKEPSPWILVGVGAAVGLIASILIFILYFFPSDRQTAQRIDDTGLKERISTMLVYQNCDTYISHLQRFDATARLNKMTPSQLKFRFSKKLCIACLISVCIAISSLLIPYDIFQTKVHADDEQTTLEETISDLIEDLKQEIENDNISEELKEELDEIIDELEENLNKGESNLENAGNIDNANQEMSDKFDESITKDEIGDALQKEETTGELGEAISEGNKDKVSSALENMENTINQNPSAAGDIAQDIKDALENSGISAGDELYDALDKFANSLNNAQSSESVFESVDKAEEEIGEALDKQEGLEQGKENMGNIMQDAIDEMLGNKEETGENEGQQPGEGEGQQPGEGEGEGQQPGEGEGEGQNGQGNQGSQGSGGQNSGSQGSGGQGGDSQGGQGGGGSSSGESNMLEAIYDPISGNVTYGEVFFAYYAQYMEALESGNVPEELQQIIDQYFDSLNK